jgi:hypothetical protein
MERCANCERKIGKLETPFVYKGNVVCKQCHRLLNDDGQRGQNDNIIVNRNLKESMPRRKLKRGEILCPNPNCAYAGKPKKVARGSTIVGLFLCIFFLIPGLLYFLFAGGYRYMCPACGMQIQNDN